MAVHTASLSITPASDFSIDVYEDEKRLLHFFASRPMLLPLIAVVISTSLIGYKLLSSIPFACGY